MSQKKVPVILLSGYLGAGKTTVMNHLLQNLTNKRIALIINDMGSINVDADLLKKNAIEQMDEAMVELQNGCICCTLKDEFMEQVARLSEEEGFDAILVEASGISNPASISEGFLTYQKEHPNAKFYLSSVVAVVDANRIWSEFLEELEEKQKNNLNEEALIEQVPDSDKDTDLDENSDENEDGIIYLIMDQIEFCNIILLNKCDLRSKKEIQRIKDVIRQLQSEAQIIEIIDGKIDPKILLKEDLFDYDKVNLSSQIQRALAREHKLEGQQEDFGVTSFVYEQREPFAYDKFIKFLEEDYPKEIIRAKGYVWFAEDPIHAQLFEQVGLNASVSEMSSWVAASDELEQQEVFRDYPEVLNDWDETYGDRLNQIVFIGKSFDKQTVIKRLQECL